MTDKQKLPGDSILYVNTAKKRRTVTVTHAPDEVYQAHKAYHQNYMPYIKKSFYDRLKEDYDKLRNQLEK